MTVLAERPRYVARDDAEALKARLGLRLRLRAQEPGPRAAPDYAADPLAWATTQAQVLDPLAGRQPFRPYAYQVALLQDASPRRLIVKARQIGISLVMALEALHHALYRPPWLGLFLSRNQGTAQQLIAYCQHALAGLTPPPTLSRESLSELAFANGSRILALPANPGAGRGFPASALYLDEFAWAAYAQQIYDSAVPAVAPGGQVTVLSTPHGRHNLFFRLWEGLEGGTWARYALPWDQCPRYDAAWATARQAEMTREAFAQEYACDFVTSGEAVFAEADLTAARAAWPGPDGPWERTVTAWDIGRRQDWTVGLTLGQRGDVWHEVAYERFRAPFPVIQARIAARAAEYGTPWVESNGIGDPVIENLTCAAYPFTTTARTKLQAVQALNLLLQQRRWTYQAPELDRELALYQYDDAALVQDSVMAAAIAAKAIVDGPGIPQFY